MEANNTLQGDLFGELVMEQAIKDKTEQVQAEMAAAQQAADDFHLDAKDMRAEEREGSEEEEDPDFAMDENEERMLRNIAAERISMKQAAFQEERNNIIHGHGTYQEITEQEFLPTVTKTDYVVVAFYHKDFERCKIVDMHLQKICKMHTECRFVKIDAEKCPFFVQKLYIQMLPTIVLFENGVKIGQIVGFEELGGQDDFPTMNLIRLLVKGGVLVPKNKKESGQISISKGGQNDRYDGDSDD